MIIKANINKINPFVIHRKASLALIRKMVHYATGSVLLALCDPELLSVNFGVQLVQVIAIVLDNEVSANNC